MAAKSELALSPTHSARRGHSRSSTADSDAVAHRRIGQNRPEDASNTKDAKKIAKRIAIVDDDEELSTLFSMLVRRLGYIVEFVAHDGKEIVQAVSDGSIRPDVILIDYRMREMNGIQAAQSIRKRSPNVKIIIVSADDSIRATLPSGLLFLQKPFSITTMASLLEGLF